MKCAAPAGDQGDTRGQIALQAPGAKVLLPHGRCGFRTGCQTGALGAVRQAIAYTNRLLPYSICEIKKSSLVIV